MALEQNVNFLSPTAFRMVFTRPEISGLEFLLQSVELPTISVGEAPYKTRRQETFIPGDNIVYEPFITNIICDENMENYAAMDHWLRAILTTPDPRDLYCQASLLILNSSNRLIRTVNFRDCFPTSVSGIAFDTGQTEVQYASFSVTFRYTYFELDPPFTP